MIHSRMSEDVICLIVLHEPKQSEATSRCPRHLLDCIQLASYHNDVLCTQAMPTWRSACWDTIINGHHDVMADKIAITHGCSMPWTAHAWGAWS